MKQKQHVNLDFFLDFYIKKEYHIGIVVITFKVVVLSPFRKKGSSAESPFKISKIMNFKCRSYTLKVVIRALI